MKAVQISQYGGSEVLETVEVPSPVVNEGEVVFDVAAFSINPMDWKIRNGTMEGKLQLPFRMGIDAAGTVVAIGSGVTDFTVGDEVYGNAMVFAGGSGAFAEQAMAKATAIARKPRSLSMAEAAGLGLAGVSAYQGLVEHLNLQKGQKLLITGGAGGIGSMAIAIAKSLGATVAATVRTDQDAAYATARGADTVVNVTSQTLAGANVTNYDAVFDLVGGDARHDAAKALKKGGLLVSMLGADDALASELAITVIGQGTKEDRDHLEKLATWVDDESAKPHITVFPFEKVREAFDAAEQGTIQGKAVVELSK